MLVTTDSIEIGSAKNHVPQSVIFKALNLYVFPNSKNAPATDVNGNVFWNSFSVILQVRIWIAVPKATFSFADSFRVKVVIGTRYLDHYVNFIRFIDLHE